MVEVGKIGDKTLVLDGRYISIFKARELLWKKAYMGYPLPDGNLYMYRRRVRITELSGNTLTDYQIKIEIGAGDPIFAHARSAGEDIRFCYYPEENMIPHWIEKYDPDAEEAIIWVKVPEIPANSEVEIYMYYGNPEVASASDGEATFEFFDDFIGTEIDTSKWNIVDSTGVSVADSKLKITNNNGKIHSIPTFTPSTFSYVSEVLFKRVTVGDGGITENSFYKSTTDSLCYHGGADGYTDYIRNDDSWINLGEMYVTADEWFYIILTANPDGTVDVSVIKQATGETVFQDSYTNTVSDEFIRLGRRADDDAWNAACEVYWDWVRVRKYVSPEPSVSVGAEE